MAPILAHWPNRPRPDGEAVVITIAEPVSTAELVNATIDRDVGIVRLADPKHRNALSASLSDDLAERVAELLDQGVGAIVLTADPPVFCAGGSLDGLLSRDTPLSELYRGLVVLADATVPTIAAVAGPVIGAGVNLPLACDVIVTSPEARFDPRFLDVGIHPGGGHLWRLQRRVGSQGTAALVLFGDTLDGRRAVEVGLSWRCVEASELESVAMGLAHRAAGRHRGLVRRTKATMKASESLPDAAQAMAIELEAQQWSMAQPGFDDRVRKIKALLARSGSGEAASIEPEPS